MTNNFQNETFVCSVEYKGYNVEVWNDDYGQSYFFKFTDKKGEQHEQSCGTYNSDYESCIHDYINHTLYDGTLRENIEKRYNLFKDSGNSLFAGSYEGLLKHIEDDTDEKWIIRQIERQIYEMAQWTDIEIEWKKKS